MAITARNRVCLVSTGVVFLSGGLTLISATDIQNLEKNASSAFCKNTFMTLNLRRN